MRVTYLDAAAGNGTAIDAQAGPDDDRVLKKIIVGKPTAGATITVYDVQNAVGLATTNIAMKYTYPTFGAGTPATDVFDFSDQSGRGKGTGGMILKNGGGSVVTTSAMQVTLLWDNPDDD